MSTGSGARWAVAASVIAASSAVDSSNGAVQRIQVDWGPGASTQSLFIAINDLSAGPVSSASALVGWDLQLESSNSGSVLKFGFPASSGSVDPTNPNPFYGLMRIPGLVSGPGGNLSEGMTVRSNSSFADSGPVTFGSGSGQWRLNAENIFGFRFRLGTTQSVHYGYGRVRIGATPGAFRVVEICYEDTAGAAILVVPGPGGAVLAVGVLAMRPRRRR